MAVFSEAEGNSLLAGLEKAGATIRPEGFQGEVRLRGEEESGGTAGSRREKVNSNTWEGRERLIRPPPAIQEAQLLLLAQIFPQQEASRDGSLVFQQLPRRLGL